MDTPEMLPFRRRLREHMSRLGLSVADLAVMLEVSQCTIYQWLRGRAPRPFIRQAVLYWLDQEKDFRYSAREIEAALRAYRRR